MMLISGCSPKPQPLPKLDGGTHAFDIYWPPVAPKAEGNRARQPLLSGSVAIRETNEGGDSIALEIAVKITRPPTERDREFWNSQLAFADVPWMDEVRIWDADQKWQWPNLPFLLRRKGIERVERYGGVDPSKRVDNDFAAVLIRKFDEDGSMESEDTQDSPLVSAEWYGDGQQQTDVHSLVHVAKSDTFKIHVGRNVEHSAGKLNVWLIYADFLGSRPPASWPKDREWAGGILTYCEINWSKPPNQPCRENVQFLTPDTSTGFDWATWSENLSYPAKSRLAD